MQFVFYQENNGIICVYTHFYGIVSTLHTFFTEQSSNKNEIQSSLKNPLVSFL